MSEAGFGCSQSDPREIFRAAADAERIAGCIRAFEIEQERQRDQAREAGASPSIGYVHGRVRASISRQRHQPPRRCVHRPLSGRTILR